jgi:pyridinium-3,5-biscarboxylic acid mononucleotide sulfurtransferase
LINEEPISELRAFYIRALGQLEQRFEESELVAIAFSAGVDSTLLLKLLVDALGADRIVAITAVSPSLPVQELIAARRLTNDFGVRHIEIKTQELESAAYVRNDSERCYHCKNELFGQIAELKDFSDTIVYGANLDDLGDYRPGMQAARKHKVGSPLIDLGLNKTRIRQLSRFLGLETADKPAMACLASRLPYGSEVTAEKLRSVESAEAGLRKLGFRILRVRHHGSIARIELGFDELEKAVSSAYREKIVQTIRDAGFQFVSLDLEPFRSGRLNDLLNSDETHGSLLSSAL